MKTQPSIQNQILHVTNFQTLISTPFHGEKNATCWTRKPEGDFAEIIKKLPPTGNITEISEEDLSALDLSAQGRLAREVLLTDLSLLKAHGAEPVLNLISHYERDDSFFPTDVYSFHVDRSPIPTATILCTYYGEPSEILPNAQAEQKILIPEIRKELRKLYGGNERGFESFVTENFFDLHYRAKPGAEPINLGLGNMWRLAVDFPGSPSLPCVHRAPTEKPGACRLLLIC